MPFTELIEVEYIEPNLSVDISGTKKEINLKDSPAQNALCKVMFAMDKGQAVSAAEVGSLLVKEISAFYVESLRDNPTIEASIIKVTSGARREVHERLQKAFGRKIELFGWKEKKIWREH